MTSKTIAKPLLLKPLSSQIKALGGQGLAWAQATPVKGSFSHDYTFDTDEGIKTLSTLNEFQFGLIEDAKNHHAYYLGDTGEYVLRTVREVTKPTAQRIFVTNRLGFSFDEAKAALKEIFPNRIVWKLDDPKLILEQVA